MTTDGLHSSSNGSATGSARQKVPVLLEMVQTEEYRFYPESQDSIDEVARRLRAGEFGGRNYPQLVAVVKAIDPNKSVTDRFLTALDACKTFFDNPELLTSIRSRINPEQLRLKSARGLGHIKTLVTTDIIPKSSATYAEIAAQFVSPTRALAGVHELGANMTCYIHDAVYAGLFKANPDEFWAMMNDAKFMLDFTHDGSYKTFREAGLFTMDPDRTNDFVRNLDVSEGSDGRKLLQQLLSAEVLPVEAREIAAIQLRAPGLHI